MTDQGPAYTEPVLLRLTEAQLECLRLAKRRRTAKQIARTLNITHHAVEQRLKSARRRLGVATTAEAIDLLEAAEREAYGDTVYGAPDVAKLDLNWAPPNLPPPYGGGSGVEVLTAFSSVADVNVRSLSSPERMMDKLFGDAKAMPWQHRMLLMAATAFWAIVIISLLISLIEGLNRLNP